MSSLLFKPIPHFHSPSLENNSWHLFRSSKTEELKAGCIDTESPLFSQSQFQKFLTHLLFVKHPWWRHWAGQLLKHNWGCCRCRQGFPGARHTALLSCPYNTILGLYLDADTHTTTTVAPRIPTTQQLLHPGLLPFSDLCEWAAATIGKEELTKHNICRLIIPFVYLPLPQTRPMFSSILISDHQEAPLSRPMAHSLHLLPLQHLGFNPFHQLHQLYLGFMRSSAGLDGCHICRV